MSLNLLSVFAPNYAVDKAMGIFCSPLSGRLRPKDRAFLQTSEFRSSFNISGGRIEYYIWNEPGVKTIMLFHGYESNSARWQLLIKELLEQDYKVIAIDAPAHGASSNDKFDMIQYGEAINAAVIRFKPSVLIGHSIGGASLGFYLSEYDYPDFDRLILMGTPTELKDMVSRFASTLGLSDSMVQLFHTNFKKKFKRTIGSISAKEMVKGIDIPTLIIHDKKDKTIGYRNAEVYHEVMKNSTLMLTNKMGHSLQGRKVYKAIIDYIQQGDALHN